MTEAWSQLRPGAFVGPKIPGVNTDLVDVDAGLRRMRELGTWTSNQYAIVQHSLVLWRRGEEASAEKKAIDQSFYGIDFQSWRVILAAALAAAEIATSEDAGPSAGGSGQSPSSAAEEES